MIAATNDFGTRIFDIRPDRFENCSEMMSSNKSHQVLIVFRGSQEVFNDGFVGEEIVIIRDDKEGSLDVIDKEVSKRR